MSDDKHMEFAKALTGRVKEIAAGLDSHCSDEQLRRPMSTRCVHLIVADIVVVVSEKLKSAEARIAALEKHGVKFVGNYQRAQPYRRGFVTTHKGSMWTALRDVAEGIEPGTSPADWQLSQKAKTRVKAEGRKT